MPSFEKKVQEARARLEGKGLKELREIAATTDERFRKVVAEIGDDLDVSKAESLPGKTDAERMEAFEQIHVENAAAKDALSSKEATKAAVDRLLAANTGGGPVAPGTPEEPAAMALARDAAPRAAWSSPQGIGDMIASAPGFESFSALKNMPTGFDTGISLQQFLNATVTTTAGVPPDSPRSDRVVFSVQRELEVTDLMPVVTTGSALYKYMSETTHTNDAGARAESAQLTESTLAFSEVEVTPRSIGTILPVSDEQLEDEASARSLVNARIGYMVRRQLDNQLLSGNGTAPNIRGILATTGLNTSAKVTSDNILQKIFEAQTLTRVGGEVQPDAYVIHPTNWQEIYTDNTAGAGWLYGTPGDPLGARLWGLPVVLTTGMTLNTALCGAFRGYSALVSRSNLRIEAGMNADDFRRLRQTVRAYVRAALAVFRPSAFSTITALDA